MANEQTKIDRSYIDNYSIKEFVSETMVPKYFPDIDVSLRTIGTVGMMSELISNIAEDSFNATSVLFREAFPNRAEIPESIYSHAAIFQLSNIFSYASSCSFLIVLEEASIIQNMQWDPMTAMYYFYLDKNTTVYVENIPYVLDYDIRIRCVKKKTTNTEQYIFTASYILDDYTNSISSIHDPYIKVRRSSNGFLALEVTMHQVIRDIQYESIITNSKINMPSVDIPFEGQLVGFDILYKTPEEAEYTTQMQKLLIYSQPLKSPFCYYHLADDNTIRLTFNAKDSYFTPAFNSSLKVILYISQGAEANFDVYNGTNITIQPDTEKYSYNDSVVMVARPLSGSYGGADRLSLEELQALTIEGYRTALSLTTEDDLTTFFNNYRYTYGDFFIKFIKRRNDVYERIFAGFSVMQYGSEIFKTNTLDIHMNLHDMNNPETNIYTIEPGTLFTYANDTDKHVTFMRDEEKNAQYYAEYLQAIEDGTVPYIEASSSNVPDYLASRNASFAEFKARKGYNDKLHVFDFTYDELKVLDSNNFMFINPFLIRFKKSPNLVSLYQTSVSGKSTVDFTNQNDSSFVQFVSYQVQIERGFGVENEYVITTSLMPSITIDKEYPIIAKTGIDPNTNDTIYNLNNRYTVDQNDLRVLFVIYDNNNPICYSEMYPTKIVDNTNYHFETRFSSDNYITSDNRLRLLADTNYLITDVEGVTVALEEYGIPEIKENWYFKVVDGDSTLYNLYDESNTIVFENIKVDDITAMTNDGFVTKHAKVVSMSDTSNDILIPMENVVCKVFTLYRRKHEEVDDKIELVLNDPDDTDNIFVVYDGTSDNQYNDSTYATYAWTNEYTTDLEPLTFIKPLNYVRSNLYFEDFTSVDSKTGEYNYDIMDVRMDSIPFLKWSFGFEPANMKEFMHQFNTHYVNISDIINTRLRNETSIDFKLYNTYGRSTNYYIGDNDTELLDTLNLRVSFDVWFTNGTDTLTAVPEIKQFIKSKIETISETGTNQIHISNLMREIETAYSYVDHMRFKGFNDYDTTYQSIKLRYTDINDMSKEERRKYVPELLVIDLDDITITEYDV